MTAAQRSIVLLGLGGVVTTAWGTELILARLTSVPQIPADALQSLLGLSLIAGVLGVPGLFIASKGLRGSVLGAAALAPVLTVMWGILAPTLQERDGFVSASALTSVGVVSAWRIYEAWRGADPFGRIFPWLAVTGAAFCSWASRAQAMPSLDLLVGFVGLGAVLMALPRLSGGLAVSVLFGICVGLWQAGSPGVTWPKEGRMAAGPDILLVTVGSLRADDAKEMQSYQRIVAEGVRFSRTQAGSTWTLPSMVTLMTGRSDVARAAGPTPSGRMRGIGDVETLATRLARHGYDTAAVLADNPFLSASLGFDQGFAVFDAASESGRHALPAAPRDPSVGRPVIARWIGQPGPVSSYASSLGARASYVIRMRRDRPLFLWVHLSGAHTPYRFAGELDAVDALPGSLARDLRVLPGKQLLRRHAALASEEGRALLRSVYRNELAGIDEVVSSLLDRMAGSRHARELVVVLTADHGEEFFEHGAFEHGHAFHQELLDVPLAIAGLGGARAGQQGQEESALAGHIDVAPTLLAAAGIPDPALPGLDLAGSLEPRMLVSEGLLYETSRAERYAVREGAWKLAIEAGGERKLYDLDADPGELRDLADAHPDVVERLAAAPRTIHDEAGEGVRVDDAMRRSLRALGHSDAMPGAY
jgi:arylsulfatase